MVKNLYKYLPLIMLFSSCWGNTEDVKPSTDVITYRENILFVPNQNQTGEIGVVPPFTIRVPSATDPNNCNTPNQVSIPINDWAMTDENEFMEFTISAFDGVLPGAKRAFFLTSSTGITFPFIMAQSSNATVKLYQETWRLNLNAKPIPIQNEICDSEIYPDPNTPGNSAFERIFPANTVIGNQWTLTIPADANPNNISATLHYDLHRLNYPHCTN